MQWTMVDFLNESVAAIPALTLHDGRLHMAFRETNGQLRHGIFDPSAGWSFADVPQQSSAAAPALVSYNGQLLLVFVANSSEPTILVSTWSGDSGQWSSSVPTSFQSTTAPAAAAHGGLLYLVFESTLVSPPTSAGLMQATFDGHTWSPARQLVPGANPSTAAQPALAEYQGRLHLLFVGGDGAIKDLALNDDSGAASAWLPFAPVNHTSPSSSGLSLAVWNGMLNLAFTDAASSSASLAALDGTAWTGATMIYNSSAGAGIGALGGLLFAEVALGTGSLVQVVGQPGGAYPIGTTPIAGLHGSAGNASVACGVPPTLFGGTSKYTIEAWVNLATVGGGDQYVLSSYDASTGTGAVAIALHGGRFAMWRDGWCVESLTQPAAGQWYHVTAVFDGLHASLYVDGVLEATASVHDPIAPGVAVPVVIGAATGSGGPTAWLEGNVRWVAIWNRARTLDEVLTDMYTEPAPQDGLFALYDFARATVTDVSGGGWPATVSGALSYVLETSALAFNGSNYLTTGGLGAFYDTYHTGRLSVDAWVFPTSSTGGGVILSGGWFDIVQNGSSVVCTIYQWAQTCGAGITLNQWNHIAMTWDAATHPNAQATAQLYVNGYWRGAVSSTPSINGYGAGMQIFVGAQSQSGERPFTGKIADVHVWQVCLTDKQVVAARSQSPIGLDGLVANYDLSSTPILDATVQNPPPQIFGTCAVVPVDVPSNASSVSSHFPIMTQTTTAYFPHEDAQAEAGPVRILPGMLPSDEALRRAAGSGPHALSEKDAERLVETFKAGLPADFPLPVASEEAARRFDRFAWEREGERLVLRHHTPSGQVHDLAFADARDLTELQVWWMELALTLICGFGNIIGIATGAKLSERLVRFLIKNPTVMTSLENTIDTGVAVTPSTIYNALAALFSSGFLLSLLKLIAKEIGWWFVAKIAIKLVMLLSPGAQELVVAQMLVAFTTLAIDLTRHMMDYPGLAAPLRRSELSSTRTAPALPS